MLSLLISTVTPTKSIVLKAGIEVTNLTIIHYSAADIRVPGRTDEQITSYILYPLYYFIPVDGYLVGLFLVLMLVNVSELNSGRLVFDGF